MSRNCMKLGWCWTAIAVPGMALAASYCLLNSGNFLALATDQLPHLTLSPAEPDDALSALPSQTLRTFPLVRHAPLQLAIRKAKLKNQSRKLRLHNLCSQTVEIVVRYQDSQQLWTTQGEVTIPGKTSRYLTSSSPKALSLSSKLLYYYATSPDSDLVWSGNGSHQYVFGEQILNMRIHYAAVDILDDYSLFILCAS